MATETTTTRGFKLSCLFCGEEDVIRLALHDVTTFECGSCEAEFTAEDVRQRLDAWQAVLAWVESAPAL